MRPLRGTLRVGRSIAGAGFVLFALGCTDTTSALGTAGANGFNSLVVTTAFTASGGTSAEEAACPSGGTRIDSGLDNGANGGVANDGILQAGEITSTSYVCNGADGTDGMNGTNGTNGTNGANGANGANGYTALTVTTMFAAGAGTSAENANCPNGGARIQSGLDDGAGGGTANDGILQAGEVTSTSYVCNGANGASGDAGTNGVNGYSSLTITTSFAAQGGNAAENAACPQGGVQIQSGLDDGANGGTANDGILQAGEVTSTSYVCNAAASCGLTASSAMASCKSIHAGCATEGNGVYWISPAGTPFQAYCDMTTDGGGWTVLFSGTDPTPWGTTSGTAGAGAWSHSAAQVPPGISQLNLRRQDTGDSISMAMTVGWLYACTDTGATYSWNGTKTVQFGATHLGIYSANPFVSGTNDYVIASTGCVTDHQSWGFGHRAYINSGEGYGWDGLNLGTTTFQISVR